MSEEAAGLPGVLTVLETLEHPEDQWTSGEIFLVALGAGLPYLMYSAVTEVPSLAAMGAMTLTEVEVLRTKGLTTFTPPHPQIGTVYALHPVRHGVYLPVAHYHKTLLDERCMEACRLLIALGARQVEIEWRSAAGSWWWSGSKGQLTLKDVSLEIGIDVDATSSTEDVRRWAVRGARGERSPIPDLAWLEADQSFRLAIEAVDAGASDVQVDVSSSDQSVINMAMASALNRMGLEVGGAYKRWEDMRVSVKANFHDGQHR